MELALCNQHSICLQKHIALLIWYLQKSVDFVKRPAYLSIF